MQYEATKEDLGVIKSFARTLEAAVEKYHYDLRDFIEKAVATKIYASYLQDFTLYIQEGSYIAARIVEELNADGISILPESEWQKQIPKTTKETAFWIGCVMMYWRFAEGTFPQDILKYDIGEIIDAYDVLHTQSLAYAIDFIKQEYVKE